MIGETPRAEIAATELWTDSSPSAPCSASMMMPGVVSDMVFSSGNTTYRLTIEACQGYNLGNAHRRQGHECHERIFAIFQAVQELETRVVDGGGEGGRVLGNCGRHVGVVFGDLYLLEFDGNAEMLESMVERLEVNLYGREYVRMNCKKILPN
jgi:hypothetical protein